MTAGETMNLIVIVGKIQDTLGLTPSGLRAQEKLIKCPVRTVEIVQTGEYYILIGPVCQFVYVSKRTRSCLQINKKGRLFVAS